MKIATAAYPLDRLPDWTAYAEKQIAWVREAATAGADLLVFPEYGRMELAGIGTDGTLDLEDSILAANALAENADQLMADLAEGYGVHILCPSGPVIDEDATRPVNRAWLVGPKTGANFLDYFVLAHDPVHGQHRGIFWVEMGVLITVAAVMLKIFYVFAGRSVRAEESEE